MGRDCCEIVMPDKIQEKMRGLVIVEEMCGIDGGSAIR